MPTLYYVIPLLSAFIILLIGKVGLRDYIIAHSSKLISKLFDCDFCLSWWTSVALTLVAYIFVGDTNLFIIPFIATPIIRVLI